MIVNSFLNLEFQVYYFNSIVKFTLSLHFNFVVTLYILFNFSALLLRRVNGLAQVCVLRVVVQIRKGLC